MKRQTVQRATDRFWAGGIAVMMLAAMAWAEPAIVVLKDGREIQGDVTRVGDQYRIDRGGIVTFLSADKVQDVRPVATTSAAREYAQRLAKLKDDDFTGLMELARWCKEQKLWKQLVATCDRALTLRPTNEEAKLLRQLAKRELGDDDDTDDGDGPTRPPRPGDQPVPSHVLLTDKEINKIRLAELPRDGDPDNARIKFNNNVVRRFWEHIEGREGFDSDRDRTRFMNMKPPEQAQVMLRETGNRFANDIEVLTDPKVFVTFRRRILPTIMSNCGTVACHGGVNAKGLRLYLDAKKSDAAEYTNFLILDTKAVGNYFVIDRDHPKDSLLLHYGLPAERTEAKMRHPQVPGRKPLWQNRKEPGYRLIHDWIRNSLRFPHPTYDVTLRAPVKTPATRPVVP